ILQNRTELDREEVLVRIGNDYVELMERLNHEDIILSIPLISDSYSPSGVEKINELILDVNKKLSILSKKHNIQFIDINIALSDKNKLKKNYSQDGLHLNNYGYEVLSKSVRAVVY